MEMVRGQRGGRRAGVAWRLSVRVRLVGAAGGLMDCGEVRGIAKLVVRGADRLLGACLTLLAVESVEILDLVQLLLRPERDVHLVVCVHLLSGDAVVLEVEHRPVLFALRVRMHLLIGHALDLRFSLPLPQISRLPLRRQLALLVASV